MSDQIRYTLALTQIKGLGLQTIRLLLEHYSTPKDVFAAATNELDHFPKLRKEVLQQIIKKTTLREADLQIESCQKLGIEIIFLQDKHYPEPLKYCQLPPVLLYVAGNSECLKKRPAVTLAGTRKMTSYGKSQVQALCEALAPHKVPIICGLGLGVEQYAAQEALKQGLAPIVVYPAGLQHPYPQTTSLAFIEEIKDKGCILSEHLPGEGLKKHAFLARNRIIVGLSEQVVIIESDNKGGSMSLARLAQAENREVHAIPGDIGKARSMGTNTLIQKQIAQLLSAPEDLLHALHLKKSANQATSSARPLHLNTQEQCILELLDASNIALHSDTIAERSQIPMDQLNLLLFNLECQDLIKALPGNQYCSQA